MELSARFGTYYARLPLKEAAVIYCGNALTMDWQLVTVSHQLDYVFGNPPFLGYSNQNKAQKEDILSVYVDKEGKSFKTAGKIDYVASWYYKAAELIQNTSMKVAFVSTNSITQGEQVTSVWKPLFEMFDITINFVYRTFIWTSQARGRAAVHCVIVGFSHKLIDCKKRIFDGDLEIEAQEINPYLIDAPVTFIENRKIPLCDVPFMVTGNRPADGGHLIIEDKDLEDFIKADPLSKKYIRRFMGATEYINNKKRWCLWLVGVQPSELKKMPEVMKRITLCKKDRENAPDEGRRKLAMAPALFRETLNPDSFIIVPSTSSENRAYIPIGFLSSDVISSNANLIIPNATIYHFGILTSSVHMAWIKVVCGRLKSDFRYSKDIVYNNFPWPNPTDKHKDSIETAAQKVLDTRAMFPDESLATLYDPALMPPELAKAHKKLDDCVKKAYGGKGFANEADRVADLMERYRELIGDKK